MAERKQVRVTIYSQPYTMVTEGDPGEVEEVATAVDGLMRSIAARAGSGDMARIAVLACMHVADQLRNTERELKELKELNASKHAELLKLLDSI